VTMARHDRVRSRLDWSGRGPVEGVFGVCLFGDMVSNLCYYDLLGRWVEWNERQPAQSRLYTPHSRLNSYSSVTRT